MYFRKVTLAAIFICQLTLVPETLMSNNQAIFHVAINSLNTVSENCSYKSTEIKKTYLQAISDLSSVFYQQNEKITELEVDNVHLKDEIDFLKEELSRNGKKLNFRIKREPKLSEYQDWPSVPTWHRKRKKYNEQEPHHINELHRLYDFDEHNNNQKMVKNQKRIGINKTPQIPYVLQRMHGIGLKDYWDPGNHHQIEEVSNSLMPPRNSNKGGELDQLSPKNLLQPNHQYGFYDVFKVPYPESKRSGIADYIKPNEEQKSINIEPRSMPFTHFSQSVPETEPIKPLHINMIDETGKLIPTMIVHSGLPGGMCQIIPSPESLMSHETKNVTMDIKEPAKKEESKTTEHPSVHVNLVSPIENKEPKTTAESPSVYVNFVEAVKNKEQKTNIEDPSVHVNLVEAKKNKEQIINRQDPVLVHVNLVEAVKNMERKEPHPKNPAFGIHFLEPAHKEPSHEEKKVHIHYVGVEGQEPLDRDVPNYWVYPQDEQDLLHPIPDDWDYGHEQMVLDDIPDGPGDLIELVVPEGIDKSEEKPLLPIPENEIPEMQEEEIPENETPQIQEEEIPRNETPRKEEEETFTFPTEFSMSGLRPVADKNQRPERKEVVNVYGNYIVLTMQNPESFSSPQKMMYNVEKHFNNNFASGIKERKNKAQKENSVETEDLINMDISLIVNTRRINQEGKDINVKFEDFSNDKENPIMKKKLNHEKIREHEDEDMLIKDDSFGNCTPCNIVATERHLKSVPPECKHVDVKSSLHEVAKMGCANLLNEIIKKINVKEMNKEALTALHVAAERGYTGVMDILIKAGADINAVDNNNNTALHYCAIGGSANACSLLLSAGCDVKVQNVDQATALHIAVWKGNYEIVHMLLNYNDSFEITDNFGRSASDLAQEMNNDDIIELLERSGVKSKNPSTIQNSCGRYPSKRSAISSELISCAEPSFASNTVSESEAPITAAITTESVTKAETMKQRKLTKPLATSMGPKKTSRHLTEKEQELFDASKGNNWLGGKVIKLCVEGIDVNVADIDGNSSTALHLAASVGVKLTTLILIRCGADVNVKDIDGNTPLHLAVMNGKYWVADILLHNRANPFAVNNNGETPQKLAHGRSEFAIRGLFDARLLKWYNAERKLRREEVTIHQWAKDGYYLGISLKCAEDIDINIKNVDDNLRTALHLAVSASKNNVEMVLTLLRCGADIHSRDGNENTPLHLAIIHKQPDVVVTLLLNNADPLVPNKEGMTAYQLGQISDNPLIRETFITERYLWYMRHFADIEDTSDP